MGSGTKNTIVGDLQNGIMLGASLTPLFVGGLGPPELIIILLILALLFGANRIPKLARSTGEAMGEFQKGKMEAESGLERVREEVSGASSGDERSDGDVMSTEREAEASGSGADSELTDETEPAGETESETDASN